MNKNSLPPIAKFIEMGEDFRSQAYPCTKGKTTIGIGRNLDDNPFSKEEVTYFKMKYNLVDGTAFNTYIANGISYQDAEYLLNNDLVKIKTEFLKTIPYFDQLPSFIQYVLIDVSFNVGVDGVKKFKKMLSAIGGYHVQKLPSQLDEAAVELLHCGKEGYLFDVKTRAVRNAKLLCNDWPTVVKLLSVRKGTEEHIRIIKKYGG